MRFAILAIALSACTVATAQVEVTNLCVPYDGVQIDAASPGETMLDHQFDYTKLQTIQDLLSSLQDLEFVSMSGQAASGVADLSFITSANVTIASGDPSSPLPTVDVYNCTTDCVPADGTLDVPAAFQASAIAYIETGSVLVDLQVTGALPTNPWTLDLDICFRGDLRYDETL